MPVRPKNNGWMADFAFEGNRHRAFGFTSELEANSWEALARLALAKGLPLPPSESPSKSSGLTIGALVTHCSRVHWGARGLKAAGKLIRNAELFAEFVGDRVEASTALTSSSVTDYVEDMKERERSGATINRHLSSISVLIRYAREKGVLKAEPHLPWQREGDGRVRFFSRAETAAIFQTLKDWGKELEADLFRFLLETGCRVGEALRPDVIKGLREVSNGSFHITFRDTKNGDSRTIPLSAGAYSALRRRGGFTSVNRWGLRSLWERLRTHYPELQDAVPHTFRHTCASWLVQGGHDLYKVQKWMGHKTISTTMRYAHLSPKHLEGMTGVFE